MMVEIPRVRAMSKKLNMVGKPYQVEGYYFKHIKRQVCAWGDSIKEDDIVYYVCKSGFADWNMPREVELIEVDPNTIEIIEEKNKE